MAIEFRVKEIVHEDLDEACTWYERKRHGLSAYFMTRINECMERIAADPDAFPRVTGIYRRALVKRFPYAVFYQYDGRAILICAVFHTSRDPRAWQRRLSP